MQLIIPKKEKKAIHPVAIFKDGWNIFWKNVGSFSVAYLSIYMPLSVVSLAYLLFITSEKPSAIQVILEIILGIIIMLVSSWGFLVLTRIANRAQERESLSMGNSIKGTGKYLLHYLGAFIVSGALIVLLWVAGAILIAVGSGLLWKINKVVAGIIAATIIIACVSVTIYFVIRWSLYLVLCVAEEARPITALKRSHFLVKDYVNPVVGELFLVTAISIPLVVPLMALNAIIKNQTTIHIVWTIYNSIINFILCPLSASIMVVLYRKLKEAVEQ